LAGVGLSSARLLKGFVESRFYIKAKGAMGVSRERGYVLVVGGAGYIGSLLVECLLQKGHQVRVLDALLYGDEALRSFHAQPGFELMVGDCRNIQDVVRAVQGVESIVHLAAIVGDPACDHDSQSALEINYAATRMLIEIAKGHGVRRLIFASSCSVYGATDLEMNENSAIQPISLYGQTKVDSERALLAAKNDTFHPTILRYATVFGLSYRPRFDLVVNLLTAKARQQGVITIFNGEQWRPFIHVRDLVDATVRVLEAPVRVVSGEIFNVGDSRLNHTLTQVGETIREVFPETRVQNVENPDRRNYRVSFDKLRGRLGFRARHTLREGILELKKAFDEGVIEDHTDLRYHNERFLKAAGSPGYKNEFDAVVMAAFSNQPKVATAKAASGADP
jgi:nucleoside-diphosphate-sugar epimerase